MDFSSLNEEHPESGACTSRTNITVSKVLKVEVHGRCKPCVSQKPTLRHEGDMLVLQNGLKMEQYLFTSISAGADSNKTVYERTARAAVRHVLQHGYNATLLAYGQTGSGKTHTMMGTRGQAPEDGLVHMTLMELLQPGVTLRVAVMEILAEDDSIRDVLASTRWGKAQLATKPPGTKAQKIEIRTDDVNDRNLVLGLLEREMTSTVDIDEVVRDCQGHRATGITAMNDKSSRSHLVIRIIAEFWDGRQPGHKVSDGGSSVSAGTGSAPSTARETALAPTLMLCDLAGSEKGDHVQKERQTEAGNINQGLHHLSEVIRALQHGKPKAVNWRNSPLTKVLRGHIGATAVTQILVTLSPEIEQLRETRSTLQFAERASKVYIAPVKQKASARTQSGAAAHVSLLAKIAALEAQLSALRADVKRSDQERAQSEMMVRRLQNQLQAASRRAAESNHLAQSADELRKVLASERSGTALLEVQLQQAHAQTLRLEARLASAEAAVKEGLRREKDLAQAADVAERESKDLLVQVQSRRVTSSDRVPHLESELGQARELLAASEEECARARDEARAAGRREDIVLKKMEDAHAHADQLEAQLQQAASQAAEEWGHRVHAAQEEAASLKAGLQQAQAAADDVQEQVQVLRQQVSSQAVALQEQQAAAARKDAELSRLAAELAEGQRLQKQAAAAGEEAAEERVRAAVEAATSQLHIQHGQQLQEAQAQAQAAQSDLEAAVATLSAQLEAAQLEMSRVQQEASMQAAVHARALEAAQAQSESHLATRLQAAQEQAQCLLQEELQLHKVRHQAEIQELQAQLADVTSRLAASEKQEAQQAEQGKAELASMRVALAQAEQRAAQHGMEAAQLMAALAAAEVYAGDTQEVRRLLQQVLDREQGAAAESAQEAEQLAAVVRERDALSQVWQQVMVLAEACAQLAGGGQGFTAPIQLSRTLGQVLGVGLQPDSLGMAGCMPPTSATGPGNEPAGTDHVVQGTATAQLATVPPAAVITSPPSAGDLSCHPVVVDHLTQSPSTSSKVSAASTPAASTRSQSSAHRGRRQGGPTSSAWGTTSPAGSAGGGTPRVTPRGDLIRHADQSPRVPDAGAQQEQQQGCLLAIRPKTGTSEWLAVSHSLMGQQLRQQHGSGQGWELQPSKTSPRSIKVETLRWANYSNRTSTGDVFTNLQDLPQRLRDSGSSGRLMLRAAKVPGQVAGRHNQEWRKCKDTSGEVAWVELKVRDSSGGPPQVSRAVSVRGSGYGFEARDPLAQLAGAGWAGWETDLAVAYPTEEPQVYQLRPLTLLDYTRQTPLLSDAQALLYQLEQPVPVSRPAALGLRDRVAAKLASSQATGISAGAVRQSQEGVESFSGQSGPAAQARREREILKLSQLRR